MSNERLRSQIANAGLSTGDLASELGVDPKTVERWVTKDRLPHRNHRWHTAKTLGVDEGYLWPQVLDDPRTRSASQAEFVTLYPHRGSIPSDRWRQLIDQAEDSVDILVYSGLFLIDSQPDFIKKLVAKAEHGTKARLVFGEPDSAAVALRGAEEGIGDNMASRARLSLDAVRVAAETPGVEIRTHTTPLYNSLYRLDEHLLVNVHTYGSSAALNPVMHLQRVPGGRLFDHFMQAFDRVWVTAEPAHA